MTHKFASCSVTVLAASLMVTSPSLATDAPSPPPPASDGSSGSFNARFGNGNSLVWFNTDSGQVWDSDSGGFVIFAVPYKVVKWNGQQFHAYNFTDMTVQSTVGLTIYGSMPAMFLAKQNILFAGHFSIAAASGAGGAAPTPDAPPYKGGAGGSFAGAAGGGGGSGPIGQVAGDCSPEPITAGGGGGGGNLTRGGDGLPGRYPIDGHGTPVYNPRGTGGIGENTSALRGGGGGGAPGGGGFEGNFYGLPGAQGGGAVVIATGKSISIASSGIIDASGAAGQVSSSFTGSAGGGAGGDAWFYAQNTFSNAGTVTVQGGPGGKSTYTSGCHTSKTIAGPNGGEGAGGNILIKAAKIKNAGLMDVADGSGGAVNGGTVELVGDVIQLGKTKGWAGSIYTPQSAK